MANIDLGNLTRYDGKIKQYTEDKYLSKNTANWQKTEKAGAVTCYPVPDTELEPIVDFSFEEVPPASGEKSPSNPSTITGISSITVTRCEITSVDETQYTVNLDNTYYGGKVNLATGVMTVTWYGAKLTSASSFRGPFDITQNGSNKRYVANLPYGSAPYTATNQVCSHYNYSHSFDTNIQQAWVASSGSCYIYDSFTTLEELNTFLDLQNTNDTPVVICYQIATPYALQLTPVEIKSLFILDKNIPRLNTLYTNADSIQVGYQKHPARTAYELENAILALGGGE